MRILLAGPDYEENLSIRYLSASLLAAGHDTILAAFNSPADIPAVASAAQLADLAGLSMCFQARAREYFQLAQQIKSHDPGKLVVAGGHYASCAAEPILANHPEIDIVVIHEGEKTLVEIADAMPHLAGRLPGIPGIAYRHGTEVRFTALRPTLDNLDTLPFPDRGGPVHVIAGVPTSYMMGSRGCFGNCAYCCITTLHRLAPGKRFRQRNVEHVADEMAALYRERGTRQFIFHDDNFLVPSEAINHARISAFEKALKQRGVAGIALLVKCRPADATASVLERLKALGLVRIFLGVESATARGLSALDRRQSVEDSVRALEICAGLDLSAQFNLLTFTPDTTLDTLRADVAFMRRFSGNPLNFCRAEIYAGTPLESRMIELGRARGGYLAREYDMLDPVAALAWEISRGLFHSRCWSGSSLMLNAIGLEHTAAVLKRFHKGAHAAAITGRVGNWVRSVNLDTIGLLDQAIERSASAGGRMDTGLQATVLALKERESTARQGFLAEAAKLRSDLQAFVSANRPRLQSQISSSWTKLAKQAAAALLAVGIPTIAGSQPVIAQQGNPAPPVSASGQDKSKCSLTGSVTDPQGTAIPKAAITITNEDTRVARTFTTNDAGQYAARDLAAGRYTVAAEAPGFGRMLINEIELQAGVSKPIDIRLRISFDYGCCEYAAISLEAELRAEAAPFDTAKHRTYIVGHGNDNGTLEGIADLLYGDSRKWIQIYEANRNVILMPGTVARGTSLRIPEGKRVVPTLISGVPPAYPSLAKKAHVWGDVVLDVTLKQDGTVAKTSVIDGHPLLVEAATTAVKQWRYQPLLVEGRPVDKFVVVVSFTEGGKVR